MQAELTRWDTSDATNEAPTYKALIAKFNEEYPRHQDQLPVGPVR
ncbi:hypothetical protein [Nocardioides sp. B-3]|nr:hypothetical protein [Nocardioides sp. B-3]